MNSLLVLLLKYFHIYLSNRCRQIFNYTFSAERLPFLLRIFKKSFIKTICLTSRFWSYRIYCFFWQKLTFYPRTNFLSRLLLLPNLSQGLKEGKIEENKNISIEAACCLSQSKSGNSNKTSQSRFKFCEKLINKEFDQTRAPALWFLF